MSHAHRATTNNQAEYCGLIAGLRAARQHCWPALEVVGDSAVILSQLRDHRAPKNPRLLGLYGHARRLAGQVAVRRWTHHVRAHNKMADFLSNLAMGQASSSQVFHPTARFKHEGLPFEAILAPWLARADALCPRWRAVVCGNHIRSLDGPRERDAVILRTSDAGLSKVDVTFYNEAVLELREVLEVLAVALRIDPRLCTQLACRGQQDIRLRDCVPFATNERLRIWIPAQLTPASSGHEGMYKPFIVDWREATASDAFRESHDTLALGQELRGHHFDLVMTIEASGAVVGAFLELFSRDAVSFPQLKKLVLRTTVMVGVEEGGSATGLFSTLSTPIHPLTRYLHSLDVFVFGPMGERDEARIAKMLEKNRWLVNFRLTRPSVFRSRSTRLTETNGIALSRQKPPLTVSQKLAFLSVLETTKLPWESFVVAKIFQFARDREIRCIIIS